MPTLMVLWLENEPESEQATLLESAPVIELENVLVT
jgi:hypothetical protein